MSENLDHKNGTPSVILEIQHLKKYFDVSAGTVHAVDDVTMQIRYGKTMGIVGESGCGKSTLAGILFTCSSPLTARLFSKVRISLALQTRR